MFMLNCNSIACEKETFWIEGYTTTDWTKTI